MVGVVWAFPVERAGERVRVEDVEIREARAATGAPTEAIAEWVDPVADEVGVATLEHSNTVPPNCCTLVVGIPSNEAVKSR